MFQLFTLETAVFRSCVIDLRRRNLVYVLSAVNNFRLLRSVCLLLYIVLVVSVSLQPTNSSSRSRRRKTNGFRFRSRFTYQISLIGTEQTFNPRSGITSVLQRMTDRRACREGGELALGLLCRSETASHLPLIDVPCTAVLPAPASRRETVQTSHHKHSGVSKQSDYIPYIPATRRNHDGANIRMSIVWTFGGIWCL